MNGAGPGVNVDPPRVPHGLQWIEDLASLR